jgi:GntR family transcriptional regulator
MDLEGAMTLEWTEGQPIYRQLRERVVGMILDELLGDGDPLPSVRAVAAEYRINPLTVLKAYQQLADERLVEKRRGLGMFVIEGARALLLKAERENFLERQWPEIRAKLRRLGLSLADLPQEKG